MITDGHELYNGLALDNQLVHLRRWAHVRRGFIEAAEAVPKATLTPQLTATRVVKLIRMLFLPEPQAASWTPARRQRLSQRYSTQVLEAIEALLRAQLPIALPGGLLGRAMQYLHGH